MKKNKKGPRRSPPKSEGSPQRVLLIIAELPETELPLIFFPGKPIHISIPHSKLLEMKNIISSHIALGHAEKYIQEGTKLNPIPYPVGILGRISSTVHSKDRTSFVLEPGVRVKLINPTIEPLFTTAWELMPEEKPPEEEFRSDEFKQKFARLKAALLHDKISLERDDEKKLFDFDNAANHSIGDLVDRWAFVCYPFVGTPYVLDALQKILAEVNVTRRIVLLTDLFEYMGRNSKLVADNLRTAGSNPSASYDERYERIKDSLSEEVRQEIERGLARLKQEGHPGEIAAIKNHLELLLDLFSLTETADNTDLQRSQAVLDEDHHGLRRVKRRILEFIAVRQLNPAGKSPILCFVGPPGVGKTSLGKSIARSLGRKFYRLSLGGMTDEAEIRGHRGTYVNALPGQIIDGIRKCGSPNPVFMLDEIDKVGREWRGDPEAALLEVLDPEQNGAFRDRYLNVPFDLSRVFFITTANIIDTIRPALRDRMEIIELPGYTPLEKVEIAERHLILQRRQANGFPIARTDGSAIDLTFTRDALLTLIYRYTREAGVRNLSRVIDAAFRKVAVNFKLDQLTSPGTIDITADNIHLYCGKPEISEQTTLAILPSGVMPILAVSNTGGHVFHAEINVNHHLGSRKLIATGVRDADENKDSVNRIEESLKIAWDALTSRGKILFGRVRRIEKTHGPMLVSCNITNGATPKDGPSAGVSILIALYGALTEQSVKPSSETLLLAATGEVTASLDMIGEIGGVRDKLLAAHRAGVRRAIIPIANQKDLDDLPDEIRAEMDIRSLASMLEALAYAYPDDDLIKKFIGKKNVRSSQ